MAVQTSPTISPRSSRDALVPGTREIVHDGFAVIRRDEFDAVFVHGAPLDLVANAKPVEQRQIERQQRLADVETGMPILLDDDDTAAAFCQQRRNRGAGGTATDDEPIAIRRRHRPLLLFKRCQILKAPSFANGQDAE